VRALLSVALTCALAPLAAGAAPKAGDADWPQWLGPNRDGSTAATVDPWKGDLKEAWRVPVGEGHSSPVVAGGLVFLHSKVADRDAERVQAFDARTGKPRWEQTYDKPKFQTLFGDGPRATPVVHDGRVYTFGITGTLACWEAATGKPVWKTEILADVKKDNLFFGLSASPLIVGDNVVVQGGTGTSKGLKAFDRKTGKPAWTAGADPASYAAPVLFDKEIVVLTGANLMSVSTDGKVNWAFPFKDQLNESSTTPVKAGDLYVAASVTAGAVGVRVADQKPEAAWKNAQLTCYFSTPVADGKGHLFLVTGVASLKSPAVTLRCVEAATGKELWKQPKMGKYHAALLRMGDGNLLMHDDTTGDLRLVAPDPKEYRELARSKACGSTWAHPAIAGGMVFVRDNKELVALALGGP
jgi:outer membrane protein assembly factor BamB